MKKYVFKAYDPIFPDLFNREKERIASYIKTSLKIEHVGSTAIPGLGGKGIIDMAIAVQKQDIESVMQQLQKLGYDYRPAFSTPDRAYFVIDLSDPIKGTRRYHVHLTYPESDDWKGFLEFRDYLKAHPKEAEEYAELKKKAVLEADHDGEKYRKLKEPMFQKISQKSKK